MPLAWQRARIAFRLPIVLATVLAGSVPARHADGASLDDGLTVAFTEQISPYVLIDRSDRISGIRAELWRHWEQETGTPVTLRRVAPEDLRSEIEAGRIDVIDMTSPEQGRSDWLDFSPQFAEISLALFHRTDMARLVDLDDVRGRPVGVTARSACEERLSAKGIRVSVYPSLTDLGTAAAAPGTGPAIFCLPVTVGDTLFASLGIGTRYTHTAPIVVATGHWAVARGNTDLYTAVEQGLAAIPPEDIDAISERWTGDNLTALLG